MSSASSILIRTFNSAGTLPAVLARLHLMPEDEIVIVDSGSTDGTLAIAEKYHARVVIAEPPFNYSKSLNLGFAVAKNPWVLVMSSHCVPLSEDLLECFRAAAATFPKSVAVAYGDSRLIDRQNDMSSSLIFAGPAATPKERQLVYGGNSLALYRREQWAKQPFDETLPTAEDLAWFLKALANGATVARVPQAAVLYRNQASLSRMFRKGWLEARMGIDLAGKSQMRLQHLAINYGSLLKKWATGKIPAAVLFRQAAHALGAYLSPKFLSAHRPNNRIISRP